MMRSGKGLAGAGVFGVLLPVLVMVVYPAGAIGQSDTPVNGQYCTQIVNQFNDLVAEDAIASGAEATATIIAENNASPEVVQDCIQGNSNAVAVQSKEAVTKATARNVQNCTQIINQYNNVVAGDAVASGDAAVAAVVAENNATFNAVQNCIQGDGNVVEDKGEEIMSVDGDPIATPRAIANAENCTRDTANAIESSGDTLIIPVAAVYEVETDETVTLTGPTDPTDENAGVPTQSVSDGSVVSLSAVTYKITGGDGDYDLTVYQCIDSKTVPTSALANTGGTVGVVESSPVSSVVVPAGALLAMSSVAGIFWMMRRAESNGER